VAAAFVALVVAAVGRRVDLAVLAVPFLGAAAWGTFHRPSGTTTATFDVDARAMFEGQITTATVTVTSEDGASGPEAVGDVVAAALEPGPWLRTEPAAAAAAAECGDVDSRVTIPLRGIRWGRHEVGVVKVSSTSRLGAYRTVGLRPSPIIVTTMPIGVDFNAVDAMPRPAGLVGLHRSRRQGSGSEPAEVRPFRPGDRLRRINWAVSSRVGTLHVTSTWADRDAHVMLLLDSEHDIGVSEGIDGAASSLDIAMRAAAAVGEHYLRTGDRVSLVDLGRRVRDVPAGSGRRHLRRLLEVLVAAQPGPNHRAEAVRIRPVAAGALVVALTPLVGRLGRDQIAHLAQHGHAVVVVDTLPDAVAGVGESSWLAVARRLRTIERAAEIDRLGELGIPVVRWRGRGTLDEVLHKVSRLASAPRVR
jgi:uncharacterized protein (DUF58 family)